MECDDCGKYAVVNISDIDIFVVDQDYTAIGYCSYCNRVCVDWLDYKAAQVLFQKGVRVFDWNICQEVKGFNLVLKISESEQ